VWIKENDSIQGCVNAKIGLTMETNKSVETKRCGGDKTTKGDKTIRGVSRGRRGRKREIIRSEQVDRTICIYPERYPLRKKPETG